MGNFLSDAYDDYVAPVVKKVQDTVDQTVKDAQAATDQAGKDILPAAEGAAAGSLLGAGGMYAGGVWGLNQTQHGRGLLAAADPTHAAEQVIGPDAMDDMPNAVRKRNSQAKQDQADAIAAQDAADAKNQADADALTNQRRTELLSRRGYGSTVLSGPGLLGQQSSLGA